MRLRYTCVKPPAWVLRDLGELRLAPPKPEVPPPRAGCACSCPGLQLHHVPLYCSPVSDGCTAAAQPNARHRAALRVCRASCMFPLRSSELRRELMSTH